MKPSKQNSSSTRGEAIGEGRCPMSFDRLLDGFLWIAAAFVLVNLVGWILR
jgi:hypothetical protein